MGTIARTMGTSRSSCPCCSGPITGRNAAEVWQEYESMVTKAQASEALREAVDLAELKANVQVGVQWQGEDRHEAWIRGEFAEIRDILRDALRAYRDAFRRRP